MIALATGALGALFGVAAIAGTVLSLQGMRQQDARIREIAAAAERERLA